MERRTFLRTAVIGGSAAAFGGTLWRGAAFAGPAQPAAGPYGALQAANPAHFTDGYCGDFAISIPLGPGGLPPGITFNNQGVVMSTTSTPPPPNGVFHITTLVIKNT